MLLRTRMKFISFNDIKEGCVDVSNIGLQIVSDESDEYG